LTPGQRRDFAPAIADAPSIAPRGVALARAGD
jgi:hypothetical protein